MIKKAIIFVGANGAGKSTLAKQLLNKNQLRIHIDPDLIGRMKYGLNRETERVAMETTELIKAKIRRSETVSFETVCSSAVKLDLIRGIKEAGYHVTIHYCELANDSESIDGVTKRVRGGGHDVPIQKLIDRYPKVIKNVKQLKKIADEFHVWRYGVLVK